MAKRQSRLEPTAPGRWSLATASISAWELEGIKSLYIEGEGKIGQGEVAFCPSINATSPLIEVTASNGLYRRIGLDIHHLPDVIFYLVGFVGLVGSCLMAAYYLWFYKPDRALPMYWLLIGTLGLVSHGRLDTLETNSFADAGRRYRGYGSPLLGGERPHLVPARVCESLVVGCWS